jgi:hypothetical protein
MAGIILYVDPLPTPLKTNRATKPVTNSASECWREATSTTPAAPAIATKFQNVTRAPPSRSASAPPAGRISEPSSGPRNVRYAASTGVRNDDANWICSTWPKAKPKPMNEPNVPM